MSDTVVKRVGTREYLVLRQGDIDVDLLSMLERDGSRRVLAEMPSGQEAVVTITIRPAPAPPFRAQHLPGAPAECIGKPYRRRSIPVEMRELVKARDGYRCLACGAQEGDCSKRASGTNVRLQMDHIVPVSDGGCDHEHNLQTLCSRCNITKGNRRADGEQPVSLDSALGAGPCPGCGKVGVSCENERGGQCTWCEAPWGSVHQVCCLVRKAYEAGREDGFDSALIHNKVPFDSASLRGRRWGRHEANPYLGVSGPLSTPRGAEGLTR